MSNNTILVTGGGSGIGRALAEAFHGLGNKVIVAGRRKAALDEVVAANPGMVAAQLDVGTPEGVAAFARDILVDHPSLNVLVNNAGIMRGEDLLSDVVDRSITEETISTNLLGPIRLTAALLPHLRHKEHAAILMVSSGLAFVPSATHPAYSATKAAIHSYSQSLRYQLRDTPVDVVELIPPYVRTGLTGPHQAADPAAMPLDDYIAETMALLSASPDAREVCVERVKRLRFAEASGGYDGVFEALNQHLAAQRQAREAA